MMEKGGAACLETVIFDEEAVRGSEDGEEMMVNGGDGEGMVNGAETEEMGSSDEVEEIVCCQQGLGTHRTFVAHPNPSRFSVLSHNPEMLGCSLRA